MDTTVYPDSSSFTITRLGNPVMIESCFWGLSNQLRIELVGNMGYDDLLVTQTKLDPYFRSLATGALVEPWGPETFEYDS